MEDNIEKETGAENIQLWDLLSRVTQHSRRRLERELEKYSIKPTEVKVLFSISQMDGSQMNNLADINGITGPWVTGIVDDLASKGYVKKSRSENDRRLIRVTITDSGRRILKKGMLEFNRLLEDALSGLTEEQISRFKEILEIIDRTIN
ncbi:MAG: MarR family winged helix-turn-helix transcriptional regulator [Candidatus Thermoplasmatota archaeon]|nr:MarR family winged helix-turn-helix transcriptional regulator [Candidatus Thermoplasmatota archaeon]